MFDLVSHPVENKFCARTASSEPEIEERRRAHPNERSPG
jgi:hypothetical protein